VIDELNKLMQKKWAVVGFDYDTAKQLILDIEESSDKKILRRVRTKWDIYTEFTDGTLLRWVRASDNSRGCKFGKMWCDKNINKDVLRNVIMPCYYGKREDIVWL
jgi:hypothetical protein